MIGAGIGGLSAAVALRQAGFDVDVYEQASELTDVGGGINMGPNATRILYRLGLGEALDREAVRPASTYQRRWQDRRSLQRAPLNPRCEELYGAPHLTIHRAGLLSIIAASFPAERIHLGHRLLGLTNKGDHVEAWFENGVRIRADVLVGADGIHSTVRAALLGEEAPRFAGCVAYRGLVPVERLADLGLEIGSQSWVGPGAFRPLLRLARAPAELRRVDRARHQESRGLDRSRHRRPRPRRVRGLAPTSSSNHCRRRYLFRVGVVRSGAAAAVVGRPHDVVRRRLPPDVPVHGTGCGPGHRGWRDPGRLPCGRRRRRSRRDAAALREAAPAPRHPSARHVARQ